MSVSRPHGRKCLCHSQIETTSTRRSRRNTPQRPGATTFASNCCSTAIPVQNSPCSRKIARLWPKCARRASFVPFAALASQAGQALSRVRQTSKQEATGANCSACWRWRGLAAGPVGGGRARGRRRGPWAAAGRGRASRRYTERSSRRGGLAGGHARHHCAQNADHFAYNSPFSVLFTEVVCVLGVTPPETTASQAQTGGMHDTRLQYADNTPPGGFMSCKTPTATQQTAARPANTTKLDRKRQSG